MADQGGSGGGCLLPLWWLLIVFSGVFGIAAFAGQSSAVLSPEGMGGPVAPALEIVLAPAQEDATWEQVQAAQRVLESRLMALSASGQIAGGYTAESRQSDRRITLRLSQGLLPVEEVVAVLLANAHLELADFSAVPPEQYSSYKGQTIETSAMVEQLGSAGGQVFPTLLTQSAMAGAAVVQNSNGEPALRIDLTAEGAAVLGTFTEAHVGGGVAFVADGVVLWVATIQSRIDTPILLTGGLTTEELTALAEEIQSGTLPIPLVFESITVIAP